MLNLILMCHIVKRLLCFCCWLSYCCSGRCFELTGFLTMHWPHYLKLKAQASDCSKLSVSCTCHRLSSNKVPRDKVPHWYNVEFSVMWSHCFNDRMFHRSALSFVTNKKTLIWKYGLFLLPQGCECSAIPGDDWSTRVTSWPFKRLIEWVCADCICHVQGKLIPDYF